MSINNHVDDHNITGIAQVSIRDRFRPCSRDSSGGMSPPDESLEQGRNRLRMLTSAIPVML